MKSKYLHFAKNNRRFLGYGLTLAFFSSFGQTYFIGLFGADIRKDFDLSHGSFGAIYTLATALSAAVLIWVGRFIDKIDLRIFTSIACFTLIIACFLIAVSPGVLVLVIALFALRLSGQGLMTHTYTTAMGRYFKNDRGKALSIATLGHPLGEAILPSIAVFLIIQIGWRETWITFGAMNLLLLLPFILFLLKGHGVRHREHIFKTNKKDRNSTKDWTMLQLLKDQRFYAIQFVILAPAFLLTGVFFHQVHLADSKGWTVSWLATSFTAFAAASVATMLGTGVLIDRIGALRTLLLMPIPLSIAMAVIAFFDNLAAAPILMAASGLCIGMVFTSGAALWPELYGERHLGEIRALVTGLVIGASSISPAVFGWLIDEDITINEISIGGLVWSIISIGVLFIALRRKISF